MAGMGGPTSRFCHETVKQQISGEAVKCWSGDAGNRETNVECPTAQRRIPNVECGRGARSGERGRLECWSVEYWSGKEADKMRSVIGRKGQRQRSNTQHRTLNRSEWE